MFSSIILKQEIKNVLTFVLRVMPTVWMWFQYLMAISIISTCHDINSDAIVGKKVNLLTIPCTSLLFSSSRLFANFPLDSSSLAWSSTSPATVTNIAPIIIVSISIAVIIVILIVAIIIAITIIVIIHIMTCCLARTMANSGRARLLGAFSSIQWNGTPCNLELQEN